MRAIAGILALALCAPAIAADDAALAHANELLSHAILFDGHNDLPWAVRSDETAKGDPAKYDLRTTKGQTDIARLRAGHVGAQFWSVYTPGESGKDFAKVQLEQIETARGIIDRYPDVFGLALTADQVEAEIRRRIIAGEIQPGVNISELALAEEFGVIILAPESRDVTWGQSIPGFDTDARYIGMAYRWVSEVLTIDTSRVAMAGVSDGANYALNMGLAYGDTFNHLMIFSSGILAPFRKEGKTKIFLAHGTKDTQMPIDRTGRKFAVILTDIDHFKKVNDTYGHPVGDAVLKRVAAVFAGRARKVDVVARYGGEEFVLVLPDTDGEGAELFASKLREEVAAQTMTSEQGPFQVTISMGVAEYPGDGVDRHELIEKADQALYYCKEHGRNRVTKVRDMP